MIEDAIILAGGFGTRLRPLTLDTPKPLLPVGNRPFLETQFCRLKEAKVKRVVLSIFHQAAAMRRAVKKLNKFGLKVTVVEEPQPLGTGGAIAYSWPNRKLPCLVLNGDILSDFEIFPMAQQHVKSGAGATLWVIDVKETSAFGVIETGLGGRIRRFVEKPRPGETESKSINAGLYALSPEVLRMIPSGRSVSIERETFPELLKQGIGTQVYASKKRPYWNDIGTPPAYLRANLDVLDGHLKIGSLWKGLKGSSVIAKDCVIAADASIERSVLLEGCSVGAGAKIEGAILGKHCVLEAGTRVREGAVFGRGTRLTEGTYA
jgi:mannose-1-phosphate guanylyltransferase